EATYTSSYTKKQYIMMNATTSYERVVNEDHYFKMMLGFEQEEEQYSGLSATVADLISEDVPAIRTGVGNVSASDNMSHWATRAFFGRLNYNFQEKYLLEVSARYNGSSRFPEEIRWGFFPSASVGYNISKEDFWQDFA